MQPANLSLAYSFGLDNAAHLLGVLQGSPCVQNALNDPTNTAAAVQLQSCLATVEQQLSVEFALVFSSTGRLVAGAHNVAAVSELLRVEAHTAKIVADTLDDGFRYMRR